MNARGCSIQGCKRDHEAHGWCKTHYMRWYRYGSVDAIHPPGSGWREQVSYASAHKRVRSLKGPASNHQCVDCGRTAKHWSYNHSDPNEVIGTTGRSQAPFSMDPQYYDPRCVPCHRSFDINQEKYS